MSGFASKRLMASDRFCYDIEQAADGRWHTVYRVPGSTLLSSIASALTKRGAEQIAREENAKIKPSQYVDPYDRKIAKGFYTDKDAE